MMVRFGATDRAAAVVLLACACLLAACAHSNRQEPEQSAASKPARPQETSNKLLRVTPDDYDFSRNRGLERRVRRSVYGYFRFINIPFSRRVCQRFRRCLKGMPTVNLHGDAHLENYVITDVGRGLSDFDDSSAGPAVIDLVRFGTSIALACDIRGWGKARRRVLDRFFSGYRQALEDPKTRGPEPACVARIRAAFDSDPAVFLRFAESLMSPMTKQERRDVDAGYQRYSKLIQREHAELTDSYLRQKRIGRIKVGFGSALDRKYLIRIEGPTPAATDDLILEAKEVRDLSAVDCVYARSSGGAFRILVGQARIAEVTDRFLAQVPRPRRSGADEPTFWIHAWRPQYSELSVETSPGSAEELAEIAYDVGLQLGRGHTRKIAAPLDLQLRHAQLRSLRRFESEIRRFIEQMTKSVYDGWQHFRRVNGTKA
jgi:hypothetical protein